MGLIKDFDVSKMSGKVADKLMNDILKKHVALFIRTGIEFVNDAKGLGDYTDRTGNLRSSIGYLVAYNGKPIGSEFNESINGTDCATGIKEGQNYANEILALNNTGLVLIVVAGMGYAMAVEARGKDVITGSSKRTEIKLKERIKLVKGLK